MRTCDGTSLSVSKRIAPRHVATPVYAHPSPASPSTVVLKAAPQKDFARSRIDVADTCAPTPDAGPEREGPGFAAPPEPQAASTAIAGHLVMRTVYHVPRARISYSRSVTCRR